MKERLKHQTVNQQPLILNVTYQAIIIRFSMCIRDMQHNKADEKLIWSNIACKAKNNCNPMQTTDEKKHTQND